MAMGAHRLSKGDRPIQGGSPAPRPSGQDRGGEPPLSESSVLWGAPSLAETVAYQEGASPSGRAAPRSLLGEGDGFPEVDDLLDQTLGQYRLETVIGRGTMGRVYRAEHLGLYRPCAIKVMNPGLVARQPQVREHFWAEARAVANLVHPHVVTVHNLGSDRGYHYIEMEYVPGGLSLKESLAREGRFELIRASTLVRQVVLALGAAHDSGLVHRDVKPRGTPSSPTSAWSGISANSSWPGSPWRGRPPSWRPSCSRGSPRAIGPTSTPRA
jgi:eukaryotic-like serine/threonine-protein kinase